MTVKHELKRIRRFRLKKLRENEYIRELKFKLDLESKIDMDYIDSWMKINSQIKWKYH
ncbi:MAG: hypothetical protein JXR31_12305 [Prolixibacteraceae bacterium]|nr:hypothetical protein [Prolixibacteraceae bacterium]MBN2775028.1 hypothetical protein [Prolixibacteraceae bacterium]